jgi:hypothetical protein
MMHSYLAGPVLRGFVLLILLLVNPWSWARGDDWIDWIHDPVLPRDLLPESPYSTGSATSSNRLHRIPLFRIQSGFLSGPVGLDQDDSTPDDRMSPQRDNEGPSWLQLAMGNDNPYFDVRRPGDPGGVGYYKVYSGVQLFDNQRTACALALLAVTPAGLEMDGVPDGPTVLRPAFSLSHSLDDEGTAIHGFIGRQVHFNPKPGPQYRGLEYGMAFQRPLPAVPSGAGSLYLFVETLGRYHFEADPGSGVRAETGNGNRPATEWEVLPGLHWRYNDNMWISGSLILPVNSAPLDPRLWQVTCSFRF